MTHEEIRTTVGSTTLVTLGARRAYNSDVLASQARELQDCRRAVRFLRQGTVAKDVLVQRIRELRRAYAITVGKRTLAAIAYNGHSLNQEHTHAVLTKTWKSLRENARNVIRQRRHAMREKSELVWRGFERSAEDYGLRVRRTTVYGGDLLCGVHTIGGQVATAYAERLRKRLYFTKAPKKDDARRWVSVEIECVLGNGNEHELCDKVLAYAQYICLKADGSLRRNPDDNQGRTIEIVLTAPAEEIESVVYATCAAIKACNGYVNESCGLHLHLDMRNFDRRVAYSNLVAGQRVLRKLVPEYRLNNRFCKPVGKRAWPRNDDRYKAINHMAWRKYQTLEIRMFAGCINPSKILGYIKLCTAIAYTKVVVKRAPSSALGWKRANPDAIDAGLLSWVKEESRIIAERNEAARAERQQETSMQL